VQCLASRAGELWACSDEASGFLAGVSTNGGTCFTPRLHFTGIQAPIACDADAAGATCTGQPFEMVCRMWGTCPDPDGGAGPIDAGSTVPVGPGCGTTPPGDGAAGDDSGGSGGSSGGGSGSSGGGGTSSGGDGGDGGHGGSSGASSGSGNGGGPSSGSSGSSCGFAAAGPLNAATGLAGLGGLLALLVWRRRRSS
jgi:hypothetical protein